MKYDDVLFCENIVEVASVASIGCGSREVWGQTFCFLKCQILCMFFLCLEKHRSVLIWLYSITLLRDYFQTNQSGLRSPGACLTLHQLWDDLPLLQEYFSYRHWWKLWLLPQCYICSYFMVGFHSSHYSLRLYKICCSLSILLSASKRAFFL